MAFVDNSRFPVVVINLDQAESLAAITVELVKRFDAGDRFAVVFDGTRGMKPALSAVERKAAADFFKAEEKRMKQYMVGLCTASSSPMVRGVITAVQWISRPPVPSFVCATLEEGVVWAIERTRAV